jgi:uncharacterized protein YutE (UPF0331/DUF86 family)
MVDDIVLNKAAIIERCVSRAREEYAKDPSTFATDHTRQDAAVVNIQRACEAALDLGQHLIRTRRLGLPQRARDVFDLLATKDLIDPGIANAMKKMVGFRNIAVHEYQKLLMPVVIDIIEHRLEDLLAYTRAVLTRTE